MTFAERQIGQLKITACGDLVAVIHREPIGDLRREVSNVFEDRAHWTQFTPANARKLAAALVAAADELDAIARNKQAA